MEVTQASSPNISSVGTLNNQTAINPPVSSQSQPNQSSSGTDMQALALTHAILLAEHGGKINYTQEGDNGTSFGGYQWHSSDGSGGLSHFASDAKEAGLDPNDTSPANQDKVAYAKVKKLKDQGLTPAEIASVWNSGSPNNWQNHRKVDPITGKTIYDTPAYVQNVHKYYTQLLSQQSQTQSDLPGIGAVAQNNTVPTPPPQDNPVVQNPKGLASHAGNFLQGTVQGIGQDLNTIAGKPVDASMKALHLAKTNDKGQTAGEQSAEKLFTPKNNDQKVGAEVGGKILPAVGAMAATLPVADSIPLLSTALRTKIGLNLPTLLKAAALNGISKGLVHKDLMGWLIKLIE